MLSRYFFRLLLCVLFLVVSLATSAQTPQPLNPTGTIQTTTPKFSGVSSSLLANVSYNVAISESPRAGASNQYINWWGKTGLAANDLLESNTNRLTWNSTWEQKTRYGNPDGPATTVSTSSPSALTPGKTYYWHIVGNNGYKSAQASFTVGNVPAQPTLTVTPNLNRSLFEISWASVSNISHYQLQRNGVTIYSGTSLNQNVGIVSAGTTYTFTLKACNALGCSTGHSIQSNFPVPPTTAVIQSPAIAGTATTIPSFAAVTSSLLSNASYTVVISEAPRAGLNSQYVDFWSVSGLTSNDLLATNTNRLSWSTSWVKRTRYGNPDGPATITSTSSPAALTVGRTYYWQIVAFGSNGGMSKSVEGRFVVAASSSSYSSNSAVLISSSKSSSSVVLTSSSRSSSSSVVGTVSTPVAPVMATTPSPASTIDLARTLPAEFDVTNGGQATYKIPVVTAPGTAGLVPNASLNYSSGGGNGLLGLGWSLSAYGAISRCRQTEGVDGVAKPITWTSEDRFCLNGDRLLLVSGTYGASGSTYKTEIDSFTRVTAVGGVAGHPDYFTVEYKDGIIETYGNTTDSPNSKNQLSAGNSSTVLDWALSKRSDSAENKIVFTYVKDTDGQRIDTIDYAFGSNTSRGAYLKFNYESRNDPISGYVAGHAYKTGVRLSGVRSYNGTTEIRNYTITYNQGTAYTTDDKLSRINKVQECVSSTCAPATEFEWENLSNSLGGYSTAIDFGADGFDTLKTGDINGDGLLDIAWETRLNYALECNVSMPTEIGDSAEGGCWVGDAIQAPNHLKYALASKDATGKIIYTQQLKLSYKQKGGFGDLARNYDLFDYNNDGRADLVYYPNGNESLRVHLSTPNPDGSWTLAENPIVTNGVGGGTNNAYSDVNGDGLIDYVGAADFGSPYMGDPTMPFVQLASKNAGQSNNSTSYSEPIYIEQILADGSKPTYPGTATYSIHDYTNDFSRAPIAQPLQLSGDFNGDGQSDLIAETFAIINCRDYAVSDLEFFPCTSDRFTGIYTLQMVNEGGTKKFVAKFFHAVLRGRVIPNDINADGLTDIFVKSSSFTNTWTYLINTGSGFQSPVNLDITNNSNSPSTSELTIEDYNGDGYTDVLWVDKGSLLTTNPKTNRSGTGTLKVKYWNSSTNTFENPVSIRSEAVELKGSYTRNGNKRFDDYPVYDYSLIDINQDGVSDLIRKPQIQDGKLDIAVGVTQKPAINKIVAIRNGLGIQNKIQYGRVNEGINYSRLEGVSTVQADETVCETITKTHDSDPEDYEVCWTVPGRVDSTAFYQAMNNPWADLIPEEQSLRPASPILEAFGPMSVVTDVETTAPSGSVLSPNNVVNNSTAKLSYHYGHAKMQAGGRGFLGFKYFTVINGETGIRTETEYRQDWPYIGRPRNIKTFTAAGHKLSEQENTWGFVNCHNSSGNPNASCVTSMSAQVDASGTGALGAVQPFLRKSITKNYALKDNGDSQGDELSTSTENNILDDKGNITRTDSTVSSGATLGLPTLTKSTVNAYDYSGSTWSMQQGRLQRMTVAANEPTYGTITRVSSFTYYQTGADIGLLNTETVEPDKSAFTITTTHSYNKGNRYKSVTTADGQTRQTEVEYDSRGRYINKTYGFFTNGTAPDTPVRQLTSEVISRDKYGTPTDVRSYVSASGYVTKKVATTAFGTPYFTADSTGAYAEIKMGTGIDSNNICPSDNKIWITTQAAGGAVSIECKDILGRTRRAGSKGFDGSDWSLVDTEYDKLGRVLHTSSPYWRNSNERYWTSQNYDILGRVKETKSPYKNSYVTTLTEYTNLEVRITNPKTQVRTEKRDLAGQVYEVIDPNNGTTKFAYDARGNMREMRDPASNTTTVGYDLRDRKTSMSDPDKGSWVYKYNRFGDLTCQMNGNGQTSVQLYDIAGRMFSRTDRAAGGNCDNPTGAVEKYSQWTYDTATNGLGQLAAVHDSTSVNGAAQFQQTYSYDSLGRVSGTTTTMPGHGGLVGSHHEKVTYDQYGRVFQTFDAARTSTTFTTNGVQNVYNSNGYLSSVVDAVSYSGNQQAYYTVKQMNARGNVTSADYGNGVTQVADYYPQTGLTKILRANRALGALPIQDTELDWDEVGNLDWRRETGTASDAVRRNIYEDFGYDSLNRLSTWTTSGDLTANETANYNSIDNITDKTGIGNYSYGNQCGAGTNAGPHALCRAGTTNYFYDKNGNMLNDSAGRAMKYTSYDLPKEITKSGHKTEFSYGPNRARYKRVDTSSTNQVTTSLYLGSVEKVYYWDGTIQWKRNIAGVGLITQTVNASGTKLNEAQRYFIKDHLGSIGLITDEIGAVEQTNFFDPWGRERKIVTSGSIKQWLADNANFRIAIKPITTRGFTGHEQLAEVGLIHMNGRIYDGALGRFVQADPIIQNPLRVQSLNRYSYVWNNPLNATDPSGFVTVSECGANCVSFSADYLGEDIMGAAFGGGSFKVKAHAISPFVPTKTGTAAYSANATPDSGSSREKRKPEDASATEKAQNGIDSAATKETRGQANNEKDDQGSKIVWGKQDGGTDSDLKEAQRLWELAKTRRLEDGSIPESVQVLSDLENGKFITAIKVGPSKENAADATSPVESMNPDTGSAGTITFNPWMKGVLSGGVERNPEASLVHEAAHVRTFNRGEISPIQMIMKREVEASSIENWHRKAMGLEQRTVYDIWEVPTH